MPVVKLNGPESRWQRVCRAASEAPVSELTYTCFTPEKLWGYDPPLPGTLDRVQMLTLTLKQFCFHLGGFDPITKVSTNSNSGLPLYGAVRKIGARSTICSAPTWVHSVSVHPPAPRSLLKGW